MSLTEMVVVVVLLSAVLAGGWVSWRWFVKTAEAQNARFTLRQLAGSMQQYEQSRGYLPADPAELARIEPSLTFVLGASGGPGEVSVAAAAGEDRVGLALLERGVCTTITVVPFAGGLSETSGSFEPSAERPCSGTAALAEVGRAW